MLRSAHATLSTSNSQNYLLQGDSARRERETGEIAGCDIGQPNVVGRAVASTRTRPARGDDEPYLYYYSTIDTRWAPNQSQKECPRRSGREESFKSQA